MDWKPIDTFPAETPFKLGEYCHGIKFYADVLVWGQMWSGGIWERPDDGGGKWTGEPVARVASTYSGLGYFVSAGRNSSEEYEEYIMPTHWTPIKPPEIG